MIDIVTINAVKKKMPEMKMEEGRLVAFNTKSRSKKCDCQSALLESHRRTHPIVAAQIVDKETATKVSIIYVHKLGSKLRHV